jgi:hypothetical protein
MKTYGVRKVKTFNGLKYGVVDLRTQDLVANKDEAPKFYAKEIDVAETKNSKNSWGIVLQFDLTEEGLGQAREWKDLLNS